MSPEHYPCLFEMLAVAGGLFLLYAAAVLYILSRPGDE